MNYQQVTFGVTDNTQGEILLALLEDNGFEGFEEQEDTLIAIIPQAAYDAAIVKNLADQMGLSYTEETIAPQNWNAAWEAGFEPVVVPDFCTVLGPRSTSCRLLRLTRSLLRLKCLLAPVITLPRN
jgi:ribosomal protein L11 methyltransferase